MRLRPPKGAAIAAAVAVLAALALWYRLSNDPNAIDLANRFASPSFAAPLGTDELGRDMLSRLLSGGLITVGAATVALLATAIIGTVLGLIAAYRGGIAGTALLITTDSLVAVPEIVSALVVVSIFGANLGSLVIAAIIVGWLPFAKLSFELGTRVLQSDFAVAADLSGAGPTRIIKNVLLPNITRPLVALTFLRFPGRLLLLSGLSFLGLGPQPPTSEWGAMLAAGVDELERNPLVPAVPGLAIVITGYLAAALGRRLEAPTTVRSA